MRGLTMFRWWLLRALRRLLVPESQLVFGYLAEDLIASRLLGGERRTGVYVDVGCNAALRLSNTFLLYARGWRGLNIDGNPSVIARMKRARPDDVNVCALIGAPGRRLELCVFADDALSSADPEFTARWAGSTAIRERIPATTRSLTEVLATNGVGPLVDLLNVDVEGMDLDVLQSLDFDQYDVRLIAVEMHGYCPDFHREDPIVQQLTDRYKMIAYNGLTGFFEKRVAEGRAIPGL